MRRKVEESGAAGKPRQARSVGKGKGGERARTGHYLENGIATLKEKETTGRGGKKL